MNSIIGSQSAARAPTPEDWAQLQERLNSDFKQAWIPKIETLDKKIKELDKKIKTSEKIIEINAKIMKERIGKLESKIEQKEGKVNSENVQKLVSNTAQKFENYENVTPMLRTKRSK